MWAQINVEQMISLPTLALTDSVSLFSTFDVSEFIASKEFLGCDHILFLRPTVKSYTVLFCHTRLDISQVLSRNFG